MADFLPPITTDSSSFSPEPSYSSSYPDLVSLRSGLPYDESLKSKGGFVHSEYQNSFTTSSPSTAPSSPLYSHSMSSRDSYFSTPTPSSLDPNEDFDVEDDSPFPSFDNNCLFEYDSQVREPFERYGAISPDSVATISPPPLEKRHVDEEEAKDDHWVRHEPTRHVDYLSHEWDEVDIWSSWRYVNTKERRKQFDSKEALQNGERLENAAWRTWTKAKYNLKTTTPESLNWMKDCDVTWLYGPLQIDKKSDLIQDKSPPPSRLSTCSSFLSKKPILKKKSASAVLLERSLTEHNLLSRVGEIIRIQQSSPGPRRPSLRRGGSDYSIPSYRNSSTANTPADFSRSDTLTRSSFGADTPSECKHVLFNETVRQVQAIESDDDEKDNHPIDDYEESDEDDDGGLMMAPPGMRSNKSTPRNSFSDTSTIAPLPSTKLKYRTDTPEPPDTPKAYANFYTPSRLQHSSSQETLKPPKPNHNFLLDDDPELDDEPWPPKSVSETFSPYAAESEPEGMRRTPSGMFMPYDENEDEAAMNNTLFGQAMYAVNTFRDIAHVVWNVGWSRGQ